MLRSHSWRLLAAPLLLTTALELWAAPPPATVTQCKSKWVLTEIQPLAFGAFSIESGSATIHMDSSAVLTTSGGGAITLASTGSVTTLRVLTRGAI